MRGFVAAQEEYAAVGHDGGTPGVYAQTLRSDPGRQNGLYWEDAEGEPASPAGPFLAAAAAEGYRSSESANSRAPYHGYVYRLLTAQGPHATGGAYDYIVRDRMLGGFALIAVPAEYGSNGIMTFIVSHDGVVYSKDLGPDTPKVAMTIDVFDPDPSWKHETAISEQ